MSSSSGVFIEVELRRGVLDLNVAIESRASALAIVGPSGAGKSSILRVIAGVDSDAEGTVRVGEHTWQGAGVFVPSWERGVGWSPQDARLFPHLSVRRNLEFGAVRPELTEVARLLAIESLLDRRPGRLSGGERQRVSLGRALLAANTLLLLDEPFSALDASLREVTARGVSDYARVREIRIVLVAHDTDVVSAVSDERWVLEGGGVRRA